MRCQHACGCLIIPFWPSAVWWPSLCSSPYIFASFIINWTDLPSIQGLFIPSASKHNKLFCEEIPKFRTLALHICFCNSCIKFPPLQRPCMLKQCFLPFVNV
jgi:hypothetical protein